MDSEYDWYEDELDRLDRLAKHVQGHTVGTAVSPPPLNPDGSLAEVAGNFNPNHDEQGRFMSAAQASADANTASHILLSKKEYKKSASADAMKLSSMSMIFRERGQKEDEKLAHKMAAAAHELAAKHHDANPDVASTHKNYVTGESITPALAAKMHREAADKHSKLANNANDNHDAQGRFASAQAAKEAMPEGTKHMPDMSLYYKRSGSGKEVAGAVQKLRKLGFADDSPGKLSHPHGHTVEYTQLPGNAKLLLKLAGPVSNFWSDEAREASVAARRATIVARGFTGKRNEKGNNAMKGILKGDTAKSHETLAKLHAKQAEKPGADAEAHMSAAALHTEAAKVHRGATANVNDEHDAAGRFAPKQSGFTVPPGVKSVKRSKDFSFDGQYHVTLDSGEVHAIYKDKQSDMWRHANPKDKSYYGDVVSVGKRDEVLSDLLKQKHRFIANAKGEDCPHCGAKMDGKVCGDKCGFSWR